MINTKILFIVEGARDEKTVFEEIFKKYGYKVITCEKRLLIEEFEQDFDTFNFEDGCGNLVLIEGPRNRIHGFLKYVYENSGQFEKCFKNVQNLLVVYSLYMMWIIMMKMILIKCLRNTTMKQMEACCY